MNDREREHLKMIADLHHDAMVTMQAALIEWKQVSANDPMPAAA